MNDILKITRSEEEGLVCYSDLGEEETTLIWYNPETLKGEMYTIAFEEDSISIEKEDISPSQKPDFSPFEKITLQMFDEMAKEINETISEAEIVEEGL